MRVEERTNFFFLAASALASAFASFLAVSSSSLLCASRLIVPSLALTASWEERGPRDEGEDSYSRDNKRTFRVILFI